MSQIHQVSEDLQYVRQAIGRRERSQQIPTPVAWTVAVYVLIGYTLLDFNTRWASLFLCVGGVVMGLCGWLSGQKAAKRAGEYDRVEARKHALHWGSIFLAVIGVIALAVSRGLEGNIVGQFIVLAIGIIYFLGGVHFDRNFLWLGPVLMVGAVAISYVPRYGWTSLGVLIALGLVVPTWFRGNARQVD